MEQGVRGSEPVKGWKERPWLTTPEFAQGVPHLPAAVCMEVAGEAKGVI